MKKGYTLIEVVVAISLLALCVVGFLEALNVGMLGTDRVRQQNYAVELARSQMEYVKQQDYIAHNDSETSKYGNVSEVPPGFSTDNIQTTIYNVSGMDNLAIQEINVNISFMRNNSHIELTDYKAPRDAAIVGSGSVGWLVTDTIDIPTLPGRVFELFGDCCRWGYYYTFETGKTTGASGPISIMWQFTSESGDQASLYLYRYDDVDDYFPHERGITEQCPPFDEDDPETIASAMSFLWSEDKEMCAIETEDLPPDKYTAYFYNAAWQFWFICIGRTDIPPSTGTAVYYK
jgi:prepilin-type N-terminal cleavage/methylation domain-containing protein